MKPVVIVGAGPAGAALSYLFARRGIPVTLLEQHQDFARVFRGEGFQPSGINALRQMGLGGQLDRLPSAVVTELLIWHHDRRLAHLKLQEKRGDTNPRIINQPALLEMLVEEAQRFPNFRLHRGAPVRKLLRNTDGRTIGVEAEMNGVTRPLSAGLVIGADGRDSVIRRKAGLHVQKHPHSFDFVWCYLPRPDWWPPNRSGLFLADDGGVIVLPSHSGRLQLGLNIGKGSYKQLRAAGVDSWFDVIIGHVRRELGEHISAHRKHIVLPTLLSVVCDYLTDWTRPGLLLIGCGPSDVSGRRSGSERGFTRHPRCRELPRAAIDCRRGR